MATIDGFNIYSAEVQTPLGKMLALVDEKCLYYLSFVDKSSDLKSISIAKDLNKRVVSKSNNVIQKLQSELDLYFEGKLEKFSLKLKLIGSDFQQKSWKELLKIPYGETVSYLEQATRLGNEKAFRAVANANGRNPISIIIPCHRVINKSGSLGGFSAGLDKKEWLLNHEKNFKSA